MLGLNCDSGAHINFSKFVKSRLIQYLPILLICLLLPLRVFSQYQSPIDRAASTSDAKPTNVQENIPDIRSISRLNANTPAGTIAWATIDQFTSDPTTGGRTRSQAKSCPATEIYDNSNASETLRVSLSQSASACLCWPS
jgi:hypothetical protein